MEDHAMSQVCLDGFELCDNLSNSEALAAQTQNLNEKLTQALPVPQSDEGRIRSAIQNISLVVGIEEYSEGSGDVDEEDDVDEVMKEEEEEESEASSSLIYCQSPDTPMTDSSFSETGSLLETPCPFSPGTSPEPTSPVGPVTGPETLPPIHALSLSHSREKVICAPGLESVSHRQEANFPTLSHVTSSGSQLDGSCELSSGALVKDWCLEQLPSTTEPDSSFGLGLTGRSCSSGTGPVVSAGLNTSAAPWSVTTDACPFTTGSSVTDKEFPSGASPTSSCQEEFGSTTVADHYLASTCSTGSILHPTLLESLEQMAEREEDTHLPWYLHQIAETFVLHKDYQRALLFIQLEQLYHRRVLENLNALQEQWESHCGGKSPELAATHLGALKHICQTHTRPRTPDVKVSFLGKLSLEFDGVSRSSCISTEQVEGAMEQKPEDSSSPATLSPNMLERLSSPETGRGHKNVESDRICFGAGLTRKQAYGAEVEGHSTSALGNGMLPFTAGGMNRSNPAEQQEEDLGSAWEAEAKGEEDKNEVEEAAEALEMEDEGTEDDGEDSGLSQGAPSVETLVSEAELLLHSETREGSETCLNEEADPEQQERYTEEEDYEAEFLRRAPSLEDMAKLITVEEVSPAYGLVSILKKQSVYVGSPTSSPCLESRREKLGCKRRVRFKVPDDSYDHEVVGGDSCLLLFLLCLVTVVISIGGTALYCALGDAQSTVCQDFSRNADFYFGQIRRGMTRLQHWYTSGL